jgi:hypothetical protein
MTNGTPPPVVPPVDPAALLVAQLIAQWGAINEAIASGTSSVSYDGKSVTYRSLAELFRARDDLMNQLIKLGALPPAPSRTSVAGYSDGVAPRDSYYDRYMWRSWR